MLRLSKRIVTTIAMTVIAVVPELSRAESFKDNLGFELVGGMGSVSPTDVNDVVGRLGLEPIDRMYGLGVGVFHEPKAMLRVYGGLGYMRGSTSDGTVTLTDVNGAVLGTADYRYRTSSVPITLGIAYKAVNGLAAFLIGVSGEVHFVNLTSEIDGSGSSGNTSESNSTTALGVSGTVGAEWAVSDVVGLGLRGGYRLAEGDLTFPGTNEDVKVDLSGGFGALYVTFTPWRKSAHTP